jgi:hypothetical protein
MPDNRAQAVTGMSLYLALSKLDLLITHGALAQLLTDAEARASVRLYDLACVPDFRGVSGEGLTSELFTAKAVGEMVIKLAVDQGVAFTEGPLSLAVKLHVPVSTALGAMLVSFNRCLDGVVGLLGIGPAATSSTRSRGGDHAGGARSSATA